MAKIILILVAVVIVGGVAFLATWDMPPPTALVNKASACWSGWLWPIPE